MIKLSVVTALFALIQFASLYQCSAQIIINGNNPRRYSYSSFPRNAIRISYGLNTWVDGGGVSLKGYSSSLASYHSVNPEDGTNSTGGLNIGYERQLTENFAIAGTFYTAGMKNGAASRSDLITVDKSRFTQLGIYTKTTLTKNLSNRVHFHWLAGPELIFAKKDMIVNEYVLDASSVPESYHQDVSVVEGAFVTGLGISCRVVSKFSVFTDTMIGIALPGGGFKTSHSGLGARYSW